MNKITLLLFGILLMGMFQGLYAQIPVSVYPNQQDLLQSNNPELAENKQLVYDFWINVFQTRNVELAPEYMAEDYIQHNPTVPTGRQAFMDFFGQFEKQPVRNEIDNLVYIMAENDMVVLAFKREFPDPQNPDEIYSTTWFDMFRIENGKLAEHWDYGRR